MITRVLTKDLISKACSNDEEALKELLHLLYPKIKLFLSKKEIRIELIEELTQECILAIYKSLARFDNNRSFYAWSYCICSYKLNDHLRIKYKEIKDTEFEEQLHFLEEFFDKVELKDLLIHSLSILSEKEREILIRSKLYRETTKEISNSLGQTEGSIKMSISRSLLKVKNKTLEIL